MQTKQFSHVLTIGCFVIRKLLAEPSGNQIELSQLQKPIPLLSKKFYIFTDGSHTHTHNLSHITWSHTIFHRATLSHTIFHTQLCHTQSFAHTIDHTHNRSHTIDHTQPLTQSFTGNFVTDYLSHTALSHTHLSHTTLSHTTLSHTTLSHTHNLSQSSSDTRTHTHSFTHTNLNTQTSTHTQRFHTHNYFTQTSPQSSFHATLSHTHISFTHKLERTNFHTQLFHTHTHPFTHNLSHINSFIYNIVTHTTFPCHTQHFHATLSHTALSPTALSHTHNLSHSLSSTTSYIFHAFPIPFSHLFWVCWKKWTCGIIRSFNFLWRHLHQFCEWILVMSHGWWVSYFMFNRESWFVLQPKWVCLRSCVLQLQVSWSGSVPVGLWRQMSWWPPFVSWLLWQWVFGCWAM